MTTYAQDEASQADGAATELYKFVGSATTWHYTSGPESVSYDGDTYTPLAGLLRGGVTGETTKADKRVLAVTLPTSSQLVAHYSFGIPPRSLHLTLTRVQALSGEGEVIWDGDVVSITPRGTVAELAIPSTLGTRLGTSIPGLTIRVHCLKVLGDPRCKVNMASFDHTTTVASVSTDGHTVTVAGVGGNPDQWFRAGKIVRDSDGEQRTIVDQVGAVLKIASPFRTLANPNPVTMYAGCDLSRDACEDKFSNLLNYGGFPTLPGFDPFRNAFRLGKL